ncbi:hypothetical protein FOQG_13394 [Fusarium oxysporum f. sp. raphani 54005]|uniref:Uncharacterized protein n=2 Tax=Fusarium oxysporum f. sp. raphani TaxID=96318 RepID=X0CI71_FUSOX|nr:hypothetical protein FOQG_13394 [Fusarium oxysporum f. sp. raphani 54005]KAG7405710.1 hypothetical protein Forpi1262_v018409 [Fusarium oxysporum f. sp. raphani]
MRYQGYLLEISSWESFCIEYTSNKPRCLDKIHKYIDACSGPAFLKLISAATAQKKVTLVHPAFLSTLSAEEKLKFVHPAFHPESNIYNLDLEELNIEKLGIDNIIMDDFDICDLDIVHPIYAYMIDLDQSTLKVYEGSYKPVCEYSFAELESFTETEFIGRYYKETGIEEDPKPILMLAGPLYHDSHVKKALDLYKNFEFCSTFWGHPTHLVCTRGQYRKRRKIKSIRYAKMNRIPIYAHGVLGTKGRKADMQKHLLWHPNHGSKELGVN